MLTQNSTHNSRTPIALITLIMAVSVVIAGSTAALGQAGDSATTKPTAAEPLNMLVLGDSIMWGQGLQQRDKFWWRVKNWLQEKTGRPVQEVVRAHSGAVIELNNPLKTPSARTTARSIS